MCCGVDTFDISRLPPGRIWKIQEREVPEHVAVKLEKYKKTPRKRPDWASMMKEIEVGKQLKRVQTNDRSRPILPQAKAKGKVLPGQTFTPITCPDDEANTKEVVNNQSIGSFMQHTHKKTKSFQIKW